MRRKMGAAGTVLAMAGLVATACTNNNTPSGSPAAQPDSGTSDQVVAAAYDRTTAAKTAKTTITTEIGTGGQKVPVNASGVIDFAGPSADLTENMGLGSMEVRFLNGLVYAQLPPQLAQRMGAGKPWSSLDLNRIAQQQYGASLADLQSSLPGDPTDTLGYLRGAGDQVTKVGQETVDGVQTTHYNVTLDLDKAAANQSPQREQAVRKLEQQLGTHTVPAQVWIDDQGRLRKMTFTETMANPPSRPNGQSGPITIDVTEVLSDFGIPVNVTAPPADQTTDVTDQVLKGGH
ncbi:hypothetical protein [Amycolatopsis pigmentata]|uniref:LppX_LprAFG lipoprotein n=1 Tax=Amycolatopsis pigmentata TaxID=450801 RepID=A0ABW5FWI7_9PSEU